MVRIKVLLQSRRPGSLEAFEYKPGYWFTRNNAEQDYDWLVVFDEMPVPTLALRCPRERTILCTWEPVSIKSYSRAYTRQFGHFLSNRPQEAENHPHYHLGRGYYRWFIGRTYPEVKSTVIPAKTKVVSVVCSSKRMKHTAHDLRFRLVESLVQSVPGLDWYGHGVKGFDRKFEVMDPYRYHVAIENHIAANHWTEKIADAWLSECLPFYAGDPRLSDVFPQEAFIPIPIDDPKEASAIINSAIVNGEYERRREAVLEAKRLIVEKYNFWAQVIALIESEREQPISDAVDGSEMLYARRELRKRNLGAAMEDALSHLTRLWR